MKCSNCGNELNEGDLFCGKCGNRIEEMAITNNETEKKEKANNIEREVLNILNNVNDNAYRGIFKVKEKYIVTDGIRIIIFENDKANEEVINKYRIETNEKIEKLNINVSNNNYEHSINIDIEELKNFVSNGDKQKPYTINFNGQEYGANAEYLLKALELTESNKIYVTNNRLEPFLIKGNNYNYKIFPIKLKKQNNTSKTFIMKLIIIIAIIFLGIKGIQFLNSPMPVHNNDNDAILCAQDIVRNNLKDPSSAKFNSKEILEKDNYNRYLVKLDVTGTNGFGGASREIYYVVVRYNSSKANFEYYKTNAAGTDKETVKVLNDWGKSE